MIKQFSIAIILLLSLSTFSNAAYLMYIEFNGSDDDTVVRCIDSYYFDDRGLIYTKSLDGDKYLFRFNDMRNFSVNPGYMLNQDNNNCIVAPFATENYEATNELEMTFDNFSFLGIPLEYFNLLMALSGLIISAMFIYGLVRFI